MWWIALGIWTLCFVYLQVEYRLERRNFGLRGLLIGAVAAVALPILAIGIALYMVRPNWPRKT